MMKNDKNRSHSISATKYNQNNVKQIKLNLNKKTDADVIQKLEESGNIQGYIKGLIRKEGNMGVITVDEFKKAVEVFGFDSPVVTAIWNTMSNNPNNQEEFEIIYALHATGRI